MFNKQKINIDVTKRHARRIIANETAIDIAGSSTQINNFTISTNTYIEKDNISLDDNITENIEENVNEDRITDSRTATLLHNLYLQRNNVEDDNDNRSHTPIIDNINNNNNDEAFRNAIAAWSVKYNIRQNACNALLNILCKHTSCSFFKDTRTLLKTPRQTEIYKICGGEYFYRGITYVIKNMLLKCNNSCEHIHLMLNIDGLPISKSSNASLWPILCSSTMDSNVYIVGAYYGHTKPEDSNAFLEPLVDDLTYLINEGYLHNNNIIKISLFALICDAPAKSFVLCTKSHTGFNSCTKCIIEGEYIKNRVCFPSRKLYALRIDELFTINAYTDFQHRNSILNNIPGFLPITNTPLDYMHLVCLGVVKN